MSVLETTIYRYDALDRLTGFDRTGQEKLQRFYRLNQLVTELQGSSSQSVFHYDSELLALQARELGSINAQLLSTDHQRSVLQVTGAGGSVQQAYAPFGHRRVASGPGNLLGFTGEAIDPVTGHYLLGNGHRAFNPVLMRFNSPDRLSPFGRGGLNAYGYCLGDPVNLSDRSGRAGEPDWQPWLLVAMSALSLVSAGVGLFSAGLSIKNSKVSSNPASAPLSKVARHAGVFGAVTGVIGTGAGVVRSTMNAKDPDNSAQDPLLIVMAAFSALSFAASATSVVYNFRAYKSNKAGAVDFAFSGVKTGIHKNPMANLPSAPPLTPGRPPTPSTPVPSAPFPTPGPVGFEGFNFPVPGHRTIDFLNRQLSRQPEIFRDAKAIRRNSV
ncbi:RHS repeat-associated core domain-containing protein [Pseudomonas baetica]|uniref:RHS repeat-associated core domain-containing protein n=1 Tax=Pseudomonas baetica TaxID=674054 RepID=UPI003EEB5F20